MKFVDFSISQYFLNLLTFWKPVRLGKLDLLSIPCDVKYCTLLYDFGPTHIGVASNISR